MTNEVDPSLVSDLRAACGDRLENLMTAEMAVKNAIVFIRKQNEEMQKVKDAAEFERLRVKLGK